MSNYPHLDTHSQAILDEYRENLSAFRQTADEATAKIKEILSKSGIFVAAVESRVKTEESLTGKLELKGSKYSSLKDITDIVGVRIITFYLDDVDKVASAIERLWGIDWENSVDKRKLHEIDSFGYMSLHYICRKEGSPYKFELQIRTLLQHAWANLYHDTGYKSGVEIPKEYLRNMNRIAGMLELADEQFSRIRTELNDYRRRVHTLVASGNLDEVPLDGDSFRSYLELDPFGPLNRKIAAVNQAEIETVPVMKYLAIFKALGLQTLGDVARFIKQYSEAAYQFACYQIGLTDLDILSSSVAPQNLCMVYIMINGGGRAGLRYLLDMLHGESESNDMIAGMLLEQAESLPFMNKQK